MRHQAADAIIRAGEDRVKRCARTWSSDLLES